MSIMNHKVLVRTKVLIDIHSTLKYSSTAGAKGRNKSFGKMKSWQVHSYGDIDELQLTMCRVPIIKNPNDVIVKVSASSVNPIDIAMMCKFL